MAIKIVTDSTSYIPKEYIQKYDISIISLNVIMDNKSVREVEVDNNIFYEDMKKCEEIPKSSQPIPEEVIDTFEEIVKNGDSVVGIFISSKLSGAFSSANLLKNMVLENYPDADITLIDSKTTCMQMGFAVVEGAKSALEGKSKDEVVDVVNHTLDHSNFLFSPETLEYLKKGGRIGTASALLGTLLQIKPILTVRDGITGVYTKVRTRKKAIHTISDAVFEDIEENGLGDVIVHHINCEKEGLELAKCLEEKLNIPVKIQSIGPIVGIHVGPGSIGIAYYTKN